jgi:hypothetical protein
MRLGFRWTEWSTPPVTATIIVVSWAFTFLMFAAVARVLGFGGAASTASALAKGFAAGGTALLGVGFLASLVESRRVAGRQPVERPVHR